MQSVDANLSCIDEGSPILSSRVVVTISGVAMTLMVSLGLLGNTAVIFGLVKFGRATNPYFFIITIMAAIDMLVCLVDVPLYGVFTLNNFKWPVSRALCKPYLIADYILCSMSSYCVAILSYDRSVLVMEPLRYQKMQTRRKISGILACCFVLANFHTPLILLWPKVGGNSTESCEDHGCSVQYEESLALQLCGVLIQFFLPFSATVISSCLVYTRMRQRKQLFYTLQGGIAQFAGQDRMLRLAGKASRRAGRWLIVFDSIYTTMWLPCMLMVVIRTLVDKALFSPTQPLFHIFQLCWWLLLCNSVVNPFLYIRSCDPVCNFYLSLFCRCRQRAGNNTTRIQQQNQQIAATIRQRLKEANEHPSHRNGRTPVRDDEQQQEQQQQSEQLQIDVLINGGLGIKRRPSSRSRISVAGNEIPLLSSYHSQRDNEEADEQRASQSKLENRVDEVDSDKETEAQV